MQNVEIGKDGLPTREWVQAVAEKAYLLVDKTEMNLAGLKKALTDAFINALDEPMLSIKYTDYVDKVVQKIGQAVARGREANRPENIHATYQNLLLSVGATQNWDRATNTPTDAWVANIVKASKDMMKTFRMSLDDIGKQIGAQLFFVAVMNNGQQPLDPTAARDLVAFVTSIKNQIGAKL